MGTQPEPEYSPWVGPGYYTVYHKHMSGRPSNPFGTDCNTLVKDALNEYNCNGSYNLTSIPSTYYATKNTLQSVSSGWGLTLAQGSTCWNFNSVCGGGYNSSVWQFASFDHS